MSNCERDRARGNSKRERERATAWRAALDSRRLSKATSKHDTMGRVSLGHGGRRMAGGGVISRPAGDVSVSDSAAACPNIDDVDDDDDDKPSARRDQ